MKSFVPILWGLSISLGAIYLRVFQPQNHWPFLQTLIDCEPFHWLAHSFLYGTLALLARRFITGDPRLVVATVFSLGLIQELAQVTGARSFGSPEIFDLTMDVLAALLVLWKVPTA